MKALIFVLEDNPTELELLKNYLTFYSRPGDLILTAQRGEEAIKIIKNSNPRPGVFIIDLNMPGKLKGKDVLRWISQQSELEHCAKIIFSSSTNPKDRQDCFELGCTEYRTKPTTLKETEVCIQGLLEKYRNKAPIATVRTQSSQFEEIEKRLGDIFDE